MHFEFLVEDASGKIALELMVEKILGRNRAEHSYRFHAYKGVGHIPKNMNSAKVSRNRMLLNNLPKLIQGYGKSLDRSEAAVVVVVDADNRNCVNVKQELLALLKRCKPAPITLFRIAVEEMEAWLLGDRAAIAAAYPKAKSKVLNGYEQDSICGTWELLADAIHSGGAASLKKNAWPAPGRAKCKWAKKIAPHLDVDKNLSPSFRMFRDGIKNLAHKAINP